MFADQRPNAERVEELGAGVVVAPPIGPDGGMAGLAAADAPRLREAIEGVLADGSYASAAAAVAADMAAAPPISGLLDRLARLVS
jgi:UDP:flavonoid glycosyltransferase YjiC (YdhE family)